LIHLANLERFEPSNSTSLCGIDLEKLQLQHTVSGLSLAIIKKQCKAKWIRYENDSTRLFFVGAKHGKEVTYIYSTEDIHGVKVKGFEVVAVAIPSAYKNLLRKQETIKT